MPDFQLASNHLAVRRRIPEVWPELEMWMRHKEPHDISIYRAIFKHIKVMFHAPFAGFAYDVWRLEMRLSTVDAQWRSDGVLRCVWQQRLSDGNTPGSAGMSRPIGATRRTCTKRALRQPFAIVGYIPYLGERGKVGRLLLALCDEEGAFHFAGTLGKGLASTMRMRLGKLLDKACVDVPPVVDAPRLGSLERWARPQLVADVEFNEGALS
jgi:hypothetical protein